MRLAAWTLAGMLLCGSALADVYVYRLPDRSTLITNIPQVKQGYTLVRSYSLPGSSGVGARVATASARPTPKLSRYDDQIRRIASENGLDPSLVKAIVHVESAFDPQAVSHKGATGLMQLMPGTARRYGVADPFDAEQNLIGGVRYMRDLLELFTNNLRLALAAYNAGEGAVQRYSGIPPYRETREYVEKVLNLHRLYASKS